MLAKNIGVDYAELKPLLDGNPHELVELDRDEVWWKISEYVSKKLGLLIAVRAEMSKVMQKQRIKRVQRVERFNKRHENFSSRPDKNKDV